MRKKKEKTIEGRIEEILTPKRPWGKKGLEVYDLVRVKTQLKVLLSDIIREIVGEDADVGFNQKQLKKYGYSEDLQVRIELRDTGYNQAKQEIREKARKLGLEV